MKKILPLCIAVALLSGCATNVETIDTRSTTNQTGQMADTSSLANIEWKFLELPSSAKFKLDSESQSYTSAQSVGPVAAFSVPGNRGAITLTLKSYAGSTIYSPNIRVLNSDNEIIQTFDSAQFTYEPAKLLEGDLLEGNFTFIPPLTSKEVKILIFTTPDDLQQSTELLHPAKAYAIARNTVPPQIPNPVAQHSPYGSFYLHVSSPQIDNAAVSFSNPVVDQAPTTVETQGYYLNSIQTAVNNGDISKAMKLLDEAERLGIKDAKETFIKAVEAKK